MRNGRVILSIVVTCFLAMPPAYVFGADPYFDDVPETHWAFDYVQRLFEGGITTGCDATHYCPENDVTRAQMAAFLMRTVDLLRGANIGVVDTSGNNYSDPVEAMDDLDSWCGVPSPTNPCLLKILPGVYDLGQESLQMQGYVDIQGAGKNITTIRGNTGVNDSGVINGADNAVLSHVRVVNTGGGTYAIALYNNNASPGVLHVTAKASNGGTYSRGIYNVSSSPAISNVNVVVSGGAAAKVL